MHRSSCTLAFVAEPHSLWHTCTPAFIARPDLLGRTACAGPASPGSPSASLPTRPMRPAPRCRYVSVQDVPRTADHAPSRTFYTFRIQTDAATVRLGAELYRAAANVHARLAHELAQRAEVGAWAGLRWGSAKAGHAAAGPLQAEGRANWRGPRALPQVLELLDLVTLGQAPRSVLGQREGELAQVKRVATLLESSLLHLDRMIALFNDM